MLAERRVGLVAHYYMDPELQGTLSALKWPHVFVADSLAMGEAAAKMAATGEVDAVLCMGVDFMAESVRATLDSNKLQHVPVYRLAEAKIGCSLAESAEKAAYAAFLHKAAAAPHPSLHVVYINTSLVTKAQAQEILPTITCTSSNVLQTVLQAYAQVPGLHLWYGPDTYMGENLHNLLSRLARMSEAEVRAVHAAHTPTTIQNLLPRFHYFKQGNCVVHHLFGADVVRRVRADYPQAFHTAHLEVPGEMFELAIQAQEQGRGVVGSTSNILNFILAKTKEASSAAVDTTQRLQFVLGTEAGMVTSIVRGVEKILREGGGPGAANVEVEIIFPVASEAIAQTGSGDDLSVVPGVQGGEGCSTAGGCATCPFMKMNSLEALVEVLERCPPAKENSNRTLVIPSDLEPFLPPRREVTLKSGRSLGEVGALPIVHMRVLMQQGKLSEELVEDVLARAGGKGGGESSSGAAASFASRGASSAAAAATAKI